jgi:membrane protein
MGRPLPTGSRRSAWVVRARTLGPRLEALRASHSSVDLGMALVERDSSIGGGLLAGALAYRLFVLLLPTALLLVSGLGLYADAADKSASAVAKDAGLHGLIASEVAATASGRRGWIVFVLMLPVVLYALAKLYRAVAIAHVIAWYGSGRGARTTPRGIGLLGLALVASVFAAELTGWVRRSNDVGGVAALAAYLAVVGCAWLLVSMQLPHREAGWVGLLPGACVVGVGLLAVNVFNVYVTTRIVENRANTYGALGIAAALLFSLVLVGRVIVISAELNASLHDRRAPSR